MRKKSIYFDIHAVNEKCTKGDNSNAKYFDLDFLE